MKIYSCSGSPFDDGCNGNSTVYFRTKREAMNAARDATANTATSEWEGAEAVVSQDTIKKLDAATFLAALNAEGWCESTADLCRYVNGKRLPPD